MKLKRFKEILRELDDENEVFISSFPCGSIELDDSDYRALSTVEEFIQRTYNDEIYDPTWSADEACMSEQEWAAFKKINKRCIVIS